MPEGVAGAAIILSTWEPAPDAGPGRGGAGKYRFCKYYPLGNRITESPGARSVYQKGSLSVPFPISIFGSISHNIHFRAE